MPPTNFVRSNPHLPVFNLQATIDYYRNTLGFSDEWIYGGKDGGIRRDDLRLLFGEDPDFAAEINNKDHRLNLLWFTYNIDDIFKEFTAHGVEIADTLRAHPYGAREFAFIDINGYYIRVAEAFNPTS